MKINLVQIDRVRRGTAGAPGDCDVIVRRWEEFTGKKAERVRAGREQ